jgi:hypothetical protein
MPEKRHLRTRTGDLSMERSNGKIRGEGNGRLGYPLTGASAVWCLSEREQTVASALLSCAFVLVMEETYMRNWEGAEGPVYAPTRPSTARNSAQEGLEACAGDESGVGRACCDG